MPTGTDLPDRTDTRTVFVTVCVPGDSHRPFFGTRWLRGRPAAVFEVLLVRPARPALEAWWVAASVA
jgi:hypothetical protein